jgi:hypothetical protein
MLYLLLWSAFVSIKQLLTWYQGWNSKLRELEQKRKENKKQERTSSEGRLIISASRITSFWYYNAGKDDCTCAPDSRVSLWHTWSFYFLLPEKLEEPELSLLTQPFCHVLHFLQASFPPNLHELPAITIYYQRNWTGHQQQLENPSIP